MRMVEMKPEHRSALLALAARRGQKGFSALLADAAEASRRVTRSVRESWR